MSSLTRAILAKTGLLNTAQQLYIKWLHFKEISEIHLLLPLLTNSSLSRRIYFAFFSASFSAEMKQYVSGRYHYLRKSVAGSFNTSLLRRNIHRLEKGLMAENRKEIFGSDYIMQTVQQFAASVSQNTSGSINDWAFDILSEYFRIVKKTPAITKAETLFSTINYQKINSYVSRLPYVKKELPPDAASHFIRLAETRKSVRAFVPGSVPERASIEEAVRLASTAPSSCNRQPFKFYIFENQEMVESIASLAGGARSFAAGIPSLAIIVGDNSVSPSPSDRHLMYIDGSLAAMNFMLALESMGVSTCPINWPDLKSQEKAVRKIFPLKDFERPVMLIAIGQKARDGLVACSVRKDVKEILVFNPVSKK